MGGVLDNENHHPGSAGILIFNRWFLLKNLIDNDLINKYDKFIITRSDFIYQLPHPKMHLLDDNNIYIPNGEHYGGYTDRHVILSKNNLIQYLDIFNCFVYKSNQYFDKMKLNDNWNLERLIKFHLNEHNMLHLIKEIPYIMYAVRNINGTTRWSQGIFNENLNYYIKYYTEYNKSSIYKIEYEKTKLNIDDYYNFLINKIY